MKSGLLSTWYALKEMDPAVLAKLKVLVCCNCDEEIGSPWSKEWLVEKAKQSGCVLVAEAARPSGDLISARKGNAKYRITFHGKASHAGSALTEGFPPSQNSLIGCSPSTSRSTSIPAPP